ncbi:hypothetical protein ALP18_200337 [Pseudomonas amygdali pv. myricae]|nr:hypothetical protein ALP18_200337 [Pseudomonas amygdali pv. myricae]
MDKNRALGAGMVGLGLPSPANPYIFQCPEKAYYHEFLHAQSVAKSVSRANLQFELVANIVSWDAVNLSQLHRIHANNLSLKRR